MKDTPSFILKGDIIYSKDENNLIAYEDHYLVCEAAKVAGIFSQIPERYQNLEIIDYSHKLIIPGMVDLHGHASQYAFRGIGMDMRLMEWLKIQTFPEESKFSNKTYMQTVYDKFSLDLAKSFTTHAVIFATIHKEATEYLMSVLDKTGLQCMVGKVNMDINSPDTLRESTEESLMLTEQWLDGNSTKFKNILPIITPRFVPTCSEKLLQGLGELAHKYSVKIQSHLSENTSEVDLVKEMYPDCENYASVYDKFSLLQGSIMAHCVQSDDLELELLKKRSVFIAHCAQSNTNLCSGIAPVKKMLKLGLNIGLGTDVAGGSSLSVMRAAVDAIMASKLRYTLVDPDYEPLSLENVFYMATKGGGRFFSNKVASFDCGYDFSAIIIDDSDICSFPGYNLRERLEKAMYISENRDIVAKYVNGEKINIKI